MTLFTRTISLEGTLQSKRLLSMQVRSYQPSVIDRKQTIVVFLPFWGGSADTYDAVQDRLMTSHPRVPSFALSYPGTGFQPGAAHTGELAEQFENQEAVPQDHDIPALAACVLRLFDWIGEICDVAASDGRRNHQKIVLCAHSMSAKVTWEVLHALNGKEAHRTSIIALLLLAPAPVEPLVLPADIAKQQLSAYDSLESATWTVRNVLTASPLHEAIIDKLACDCIATSPAARRGWIELGMKHDCTETVQALAQMLKAADDMAHLPIKVVVGENDRVETPENVQTQTIDVLQRLGLSASMKVVPGIGHLLPVEAIDEVVTALSDLL
jgi:3-oxoadipate enol-lactonase